MTGDVNRCDLLVEHLRPGFRELVDGVVHAQLVPGDGLGGDDHGVAAFDADRGMVVVGDPHERGEGLSLRAGA